MACVEAHIGVEQGLHPLVVDAADRDRLAPEESMVDEEELGALLDRGVDAGLARVDGQGDLCDLALGTAGDLHPIERDVVEVGDLQRRAEDSVEFV